jgi:hypothetical protein
MRRLTLGMVSLLFVGALAGSTYRAMHEESDLCAGFTAAKMLEDPELARQFFSAWHDGDVAARAHLESLVTELRAAHHCAGGESAYELELGHPSPGAPRGTPRLPPGHPPIDGAPSTPTFGTTPTHTI